MRVIGHAVGGILGGNDLGDDVVPARAAHGLRHAGDHDRLLAQALHIVGVDGEHAGHEAHVVVERGVAAVELVDIGGLFRGGIGDRAFERDAHAGVRADIVEVELRRALVGDDLDPEVVGVEPVATHKELVHLRSLRHGLLGIVLVVEGIEALARGGIDVVISGDGEVLAGVLALGGGVLGDARHLPAHVERRVVGDARDLGLELQLALVVVEAVHAVVGVLDEQELVGARLAEGQLVDVDGDIGALAASATTRHGAGAVVILRVRIPHIHVVGEHAGREATAREGLAEVDLLITDHEERAVADRNDGATLLIGRDGVVRTPHGDLAVDHRVAHAVDGDGGAVGGRAQHAVGHVVVDEVHLAVGLLRGIGVEARAAVVDLVAVLELAVDSRDRDLESILGARVVHAGDRVGLVLHDVVDLGRVGRRGLREREPVIDGAGLGGGGLGVEGVGQALDAHGVVGRHGVFVAVDGDDALLGHRVVGGDGVGGGHRVDVHHVRLAEDAHGVGALLRAGAADGIVDVVDGDGGEHAIGLFAGVVERGDGAHGDGGHGDLSAGDGVGGAVDGHLVVDHAVGDAAIDHDVDHLVGGDGLVGTRLDGPRDIGPSIGVGVDGVGGRGVVEVVAGSHLGGAGERVRVVTRLIPDRELEHVGGEVETLLAGELLLHDARGELDRHRIGGVVVGEGHLLGVGHGDGGTLAGILAGSERCGRRGHGGHERHGGNAGRSGNRDAIALALSGVCLSSPHNHFGAAFLGGFLIPFVGGGASQSPSCRCHDAPPPPVSRTGTGMPRGLAVCRRRTGIIAWSSLPRRGRRSRPNRRCFQLWPQNRAFPAPRWCISRHRGGRRS